jgi:hypothetical protein
MTITTYTGIAKKGRSHNVKSFLNHKLDLVKLSFNININNIFMEATDVLFYKF